jgi:Prokaryotic N-terminal methylation motif
MQLSAVGPHSLNQERRRERGVSLIEALVALTVMSFGMLAVVGVQGTLRMNSDVAKQRSEGVRIAQETMESWRGFAQLTVDPAGDRRSYADIAPTAATAVVGYTTNTNYTVEREVLNSANLNHKAIRVTVRWIDRNGQGQSVNLDSYISRSDPAATAALLSAPAVPGGSQLQPLGRHAAIPLTAKDMGGGLSAFKPPGEGGSTTAWVFNNLSGLIVGVCSVSAGTSTAALSASDIAGCKDNTLAHLLSGYVRFGGATQPTATDAEDPQGRARNLDMQLAITDGRTPTCFDDAPTTTTAAATQTFVSYYCAIPANTTRSWAGFSTIAPLPFTDAVDSNWSIPGKTAASESTATHRLCRYTPAINDTQVVPNPQHPQLYRIEYADPARQLQPLPMPPLVNQNFLVTLIAHSCPTDVAADPLKGDFVNSNTLAHKPVS